MLLDSWPGQMRTVYGDHQRFFDTYFRTYPGMYFTGDGCRRDEDGYYWITGRVDDVLNVSGHRIGTAEVESALVADTKVAEAAVVGYPHDIKGQGIYAYVTLKQRRRASDDLKRELRADGDAAKSAPSPRPTSSSSRPACRRRAPARSCAASCARSPRTTLAISATPARWPIRRGRRSGGEQDGGVIVAVRKKIGGAGRAARKSCAKRFAFIRIGAAISKADMG